MQQLMSSSEQDSGDFDFENDDIDDDENDEELDYERR